MSRKFQDRIPAQPPRPKAPALAKALLVLGGTLIIAGSFLPEMAAAAGRILQIQVRIPDQSSWIVWRGSLDLLLDPDMSLQRRTYIFCAAEVAGLATPVIAGFLFAASAFLGRSKAAAAGCFLVHALLFWGLALAALAIPDLGAQDISGKATRQALAFLGGAGLLGALLALEVVSLGWAARRARRCDGSFPVDAVNLTPAAFMLILNAILYAVLHGHPNWPAGGYAVASLGALLVLVAMALRQPRLFRCTPPPPAGGGGGSEKPPSEGRRQRKSLRFRRS